MYGPLCCCVTSARARRRRSSKLVGSLLLVLCLAALGLFASSVTASAAQADPTGNITGTVTDASNGHPLAGIDLTAYLSNGSGSWDFVSQVATTSTGSYVISGLSAGAYRIKFVDWNHTYVSQWYDGVAATASDSAANVEVTDGATTPGIDAALQAGGHITGTVTDWNHVGIPGFEVMVFGTDDVSVGWTDVAGRYDVGGLATGTYHVEFNDYTDSILTQFYNNKSSLGQADDVAVTVGEVTANVDATLAEEATVTGTITDATNGNPIPYAGVSFQPLGVPVGTGVCGAGTDANGHYTCKMLAGRYLVEFNGSSYQPMYYGGSTTEIGSTPFVITAGQVVDNVDMQLTLMPSTVLGVTRDMDNVVVPGIAVEVVRADNGAVVGRATSDADGKYKIVLTDLYPDAPRWSLVELRVRFTDPKGVYATQLSEPSSVGPSSGFSQSSWLVAAKPGEVKGKTLDWDGAVVPGVAVTVVTSTGNAVASTTSDANGDYDLTGVPVALHTQYDVRFNDPSGAHRFQAFAGAFVPSGGVATVDSSMLAPGTTSVGPDGSWVWQEPKLQGSDLLGVCAGDDDHLWAVGAHGTILKSVDGGLTWHTSYSSTMTDLYAVAASGASRAWAVGSGGAVFATTDGGLHWTQQDSKVGGDLYAVQFVDASHGWAVGWGGAIIATADGGQTWALQSSGLVFPLLAMTFTDASHGWVVGAYGVELVTSDGGQHWTKVTTGTSDWLTGITMPDGKHGWISTDGGRVLVTSDGGATWKVQTSWTYHSFVAACAVDATHCCVLDEDGHSLYTSDGGAHWYTVWAITQSWTGITRAPSGQLWAVGTAGTLMHSTGGSSWGGIGGDVPPVFRFRAVDFPDAQHGWTVGDSGTVWWTVDGGASWSHAYPGGGAAALSAPDATHVWFVGGSGQITCTPDGGATWVQQSSGTTKTLEGVSFPDVTHGWVVGLGGTILATADGGSTWSPQVSGSEADLTAVSFADDLHGVAVGYLGTVLVTTDGGKTWTQRPSGTTAKLNAVSCPDATHAWAVGDFSATIASSNGYQSWKPRDDIGSNFSVSFPDATHGWAAGQWGIWATIDGGATWALQTEHTGGFFYGVSAPDATHCWAVGDDVILKYDPAAADTTAPTGTMRINGGASSTASDTVSVDSAMTDVHGTVLMRFSTDGGSTWASWRDYASTATLTLPSGGGPKTVTGQYEDGAGNVATRQATIVVATGLPTVGVTGASDGAWSSHPVTLVFSAMAPPASGGVAGLTLDLDGAVSTVSGSQASLPIPVVPNGTHVVKYHATDALGRSGADQTLTVHIDTAGPVTKGKAVSGRVRRPVALSFIVNDNLSPQAVGVKVTIRSRGRTVRTLKLAAQTVGTWHKAKWTPTAKGKYTYVVAASDLAGNPRSRAVAGSVTVR
jgi:photosystem II stability/assembly factor-like uncharacterized protein